MSDPNRYLQAERIGEWLRAQSGRVPRPLLDSDLEEIEQRAAQLWTDASPDLLRLVAEVRGLRSRLGQVEPAPDSRTSGS